MSNREIACDIVIKVRSVGVGGNIVSDVEKILDGLHAPDTHAADFETVRDALKQFDWLADLMDRDVDMQKARSALAALGRLEGR